LFNYLKETLRYYSIRKIAFNYRRDYWRDSDDDDFWLSQSNYAGARTELGKDAEVQNDKDVVLRSKVENYDDIKNDDERDIVEIKTPEEHAVVHKEYVIEEQKDDMVDSEQDLSDLVKCPENIFDDIKVENFNIEDPRMKIEMDDRALAVSVLDYSIGLVTLNIVDTQVSCGTYLEYVTPAIQCKLWDPGKLVKYCA